MAIDITKLSLEEKRELVMRYADRYDAGLVPMDPPAIDVELAKYLQLERDEQDVAKARGAVRNGPAAGNTTRH